MEKSPFFHPRSNRVDIHSAQTTAASISSTTTPGGSKRYIVSSHKVGSSYTTSTGTGTGTAAQTDSTDATISGSSTKRSTLWGTASNLINAIVGCGIVGIPYALRQCGCVCGIALIVLCAFLTDKSLRVLINTAKHVHVSTYEMLCESCFGTYGFYFVTVNMFLCAYGAMISYLMIVKDSFGTLLLGSSSSSAKHDGNIAIVDDHRWTLAADSIEMRRTLLLVIALTIIVPLSCQRDMADLAVTSRWNVVIDTILVSLIAYNAIPAYFNHNSSNTSNDEASLPEQLHHSTGLDPTTLGFWIQLDTLFIGLGVLSFAFVCQHSAFLIAGSLHQPTAVRWAGVTRRALIVCMILALVCGICGYLGYQDATQGNVLVNLPPDSVTANVARALLGTTMLFVYPLESFVARHVGVVLLFTGRLAHEGDDSYILARPDRRVLLTVALFGAAVVPALFATDLGPILAITGSIGGSCLSYIGPGVCYLGVHGERFLQLARGAFSGNRPTMTSTDAASAMESTPLVSMGTTSNGQQETNKVAVSGIVNTVVWYATAMPLWCALARWGQARLEQHVYEMALKSPHPIRIGDVEYSRVLWNAATKQSKQQGTGATTIVTDENGDEVEAGTPTIVRKHSLPHLHNLDNSTGINQQIGQGLLLAQQELVKGKNAKVAVAPPPQTTTQQLEADPQQEPPEWSDFVGAIFYILLGLVAMFAGIYSIFVSK